MISLQFNINQWFGSYMKFLHLSTIPRLIVPFGQIADDVLRQDLDGARDLLEQRILWHVAFAALITQTVKSFDGADFIYGRFLSRKFKAVWFFAIALRDSLCV